jgi:small subunit ribosomal protein S4e
VLGLARTSKEAKFIFTERNVLVNGIRINEPKYPVGIFDSIEIKELGQCYRMVFDMRGNLKLVATDKKDAELKPVKVKAKTVLSKGKLQLNFSDGTNLIADKSYAIGDVLLLKLPKTITSVIKLEKGVLVYIVGGKSSGKLGVVKDITADGVTFTVDNKDFKTLKEYAFQIGKDKPVIKLHD